jgi:DNA-binding winged helix-turn-helix (wHTH) protein
VKLCGQPYLILDLLGRAGEVVTREEIRDRVWPADTFVDFEHGLNTAVKKLRQVLCDSAEAPRYIETAPRLGYRFIAPVEIIVKRTVSPAEAVALEEASAPTPSVPAPSVTERPQPSQSSNSRWRVLGLSLATVALLGVG